MLIDRANTFGIILDDISIVSKVQNEVQNAGFT